MSAKSPKREKIREAEEGDDGERVDAPEAEDSSAPRLSVAVWGLVVFAGCRAIEVVLEAQSMAGAIGQAVLVEWSTSRLGIAWSSPKTPMTTGLLARRAAIGAAIGFVIAGVVFAVLLLGRGAVVARANAEPSILAIGLVTAGLAAWRDELLLRGVVLRTLEGVDLLRSASGNALARALACGVVGAGAAIGRPDASARSVVVGALLGTIFGVLWIEDQGAWRPWAANAGLRFATGTLLGGGVVHCQLADNSWAGSSGILGGTAAVVAIAPLTIVALVRAARS